MMKILAKIFLLCIGVAILSGCNEEEAQATETSPNTAVNTPASESQPPQVQQPQQVQCDNCGTVAHIQMVAASGDGSGAGAAIGAVVGGLLGNQVGGGNGKKVATVVGVVGGALAGNEVEKRSKTETYFDVTVDMATGGTRTVSVANADQLHIGDEVKVVGNNLELL